MLQRNAEAVCCRLIEQRRCQIDDRDPWCAVRDPLRLICDVFRQFGDSRPRNRMGTCSQRANAGRREQRATHGVGSCGVTVARKRTREPGLGIVDWRLLRIADCGLRAIADCSLQIARVHDSTGRSEDAPCTGVAGCVEGSGCPSRRPERRAGRSRSQRPSIEQPRCQAGIRRIA